MPDDAPPPGEAARYFLSIGFSAADKQRLRELSAKARGSAPTAAGEAEIDTFERIGHVLAILQSKARRALCEIDSRAS